MRPENTAGRGGGRSSTAAVEGRAASGTGPMFRQTPQRGRYRQFHQVGAEALGLAGPDVDASRS